MKDERIRQLRKMVARRELAKDIKFVEAFAEALDAIEAYRKALERIAGLQRKAMETKYEENEYPYTQSYDCAKGEWVSWHFVRAIVNEALGGDKKLETNCPFCLVPTQGGLACSDCEKEETKTYFEDLKIREEFHE